MFSLNNTASNNQNALHAKQQYFFDHSSGNHATNRTNSNFRQRGFTLLEIVFSLAIFSLLAVLNMKAELGVIHYFSTKSKSLEARLRFQKIKSAAHTVIGKGQFSPFHSVRVGPREPSNLHPKIRATLLRYPINNSSDYLISEELSPAGSFRVVTESSRTSGNRIGFCSTHPLAPNLKNLKSAWLVGANDFALAHGQFSRDSAQLCPHSSGSFQSASSISFEPLYLFAVLKQRLLYLDSRNNIRAISYPKLDNQPIESKTESFQIKRKRLFEIEAQVSEQFFREKIIAFNQLESFDNFDLLP